MVCYVVPASAAIMHYFMRKKIPSMKDKYNVWLNQMLAGGAIFGIVDHIWNGELFLIGDNIFWDIGLGATITAAIMTIWLGMVFYDKARLRAPASE